MHTGGFGHWAAACVEADRFVDRRDLGAAPGDDPLAWHRAGHERLMSVLGAVDPDEPRWTFGPDRRAAFWFRRAAQELGVHRWDVESATGDPAPLDPDLAADGIDEMLEVFDRVGRIAERFAAGGATLHLHATDVGAAGGSTGEWLVVAGDEALGVRREHAEADVAAHGTASGLLLALWGRVPLDALDVRGDAGLLERWQERVRI